MKEILLRLALILEMILNSQSPNPLLDQALNPETLTTFSEQ